MRTIAIANQKGGCGKTTTAINLSACLALNNIRVLLIDLDPQSHASIGLGVKVEELEKSIYDIFSESHRRSLDDVIVEVDQNFDLAPSQLILSAVEQELAGKAGRESVLVRSIQKTERHYDYIICLEGTIHLGLKDLRLESPTYGVSNLLEMKGDCGQGQSSLVGPPSLQLKNPCNEISSSTFGSLQSAYPAKI